MQVADPRITGLVGTGPTAIPSYGFPLEDGRGEREPKPTLAQLPLAGTLAANFRPRLPVAENRPDGSPPLPTIVILPGLRVGTGKSRCLGPARRLRCDRASSSTFVEKFAGSGLTVAPRIAPRPTDRNIPVAAQESSQSPPYSFQLTSAIPPSARCGRNLRGSTFPLESHDPSLGRLREQCHWPVA